MKGAPTPEEAASLVPAGLCRQIVLAERERREVTLADGSRRVIPYVGPIRVRFGNRPCFVGAMVLGHEVILARQSLPADL